MISSQRRPSRLTPSLCSARYTWLEFLFQVDTWIILFWDNFFLTYGALRIASQKGEFKVDSGCWQKHVGRCPRIWKHKIPKMKGLTSASSTAGDTDRLGETIPPGTHALGVPLTLLPLLQSPDLPTLAVIFNSAADLTKEKPWVVKWTGGQGIQVLLGQDESCICSQYEVLCWAVSRSFSVTVCNRWSASRGNWRCVIGNAFLGRAQGITLFMFWFHLDTHG